MHPQEAGFTPRYEWRGRERCIVWRCCGQDARQGKREVWGERVEPDGQKIKTLEYASVCKCLECGRSI